MNTFNKSTFQQRIKTTLLIVIIIIEYYSTQVVHYKRENSLKLQTIIQEEISRFGRNIFKDGASVNPGKPTVDNAFEFIKLDTSVNTLPTDTSTLVGLEFTGSTSSVKSRVIRVETLSGSDPPTLYVQYTDTNTSGLVQVLQ